MSLIVGCVLCFVAGAGAGVAGALSGRRLFRVRRSLRTYRKRLEGPRPGLAFYVIPAELGDPNEVVADLTGNRRPRLCLIGRLCGPLASDDRPGGGIVPEAGLERGALWVAQGLLIFDPVREGAEMSVLEAPYGVEVREPMVTEAGIPTVTFDLGDSVLVFEPTPDNDASNAWSRIQSVLEFT
ncbi:hypothetical protein GCM10023191_003500 [Actinoallomurus oryzae]|jgi:hypothetical protein|uniref:Secreted protein n=1 Tax=Actinoallomurus oryzae TaxID=502180 RepID=A0ABP8P9B4_9ACTN|nr:hypothetical protein [Actinoallomurus sp. NBC_01490]